MILDMVIPHGVKTLKKSLSYFFIKMYPIGHIKLIFEVFYEFQFLRPLFGRLKTAGFCQKFGTPFLKKLEGTIDCWFLKSIGHSKLINTNLKRSFKCEFR